MLHLHVLYWLTINVFLSYSCNAQADLAHCSGDWMPRRQQLPCSLRLIPELHEHESLNGRAAHLTSHRAGKCTGVLSGLASEINSFMCA